MRYEVTATVDGVPIVFSDDPSVGPRAAAGQAVQLFVQGANVMPGGQLVPGTAAPWRTQVGTFVPTEGSLQIDQRSGYRFTLLFDRSVASDISVERVAVWFQ